MVDIWCVALDAPDDAPRSLLSIEEQQRADRFVFDRDRRRYVIAHAALRQLLARYTAADLTFTYGPRGKPALIDTEVRFNLAHSDDVALVAISTECEVGVDVERVRTISDLEAIANRYFCLRERAAIMACQGDARVLTFMRFWTRKEALLKLTGDGLSLPLDCVDVAWPDARSTLTVADGSGVSHCVIVADLHVANDYAAAVAVEGDTCDIAYRGAFSPTGN